MYTSFSLLITGILFSQLEVQAQNLKTFCTDQENGVLKCVAGQPTKFFICNTVIGPVLQDLAAGQPCAGAQTVTLNGPNPTPTSEPEAASKPSSRNKDPNYIPWSWEQGKKDPPKDDPNHTSIPWSWDENKNAPKEGDPFSWETREWDPKSTEGCPD